jgi:hypothetical protein
LLLSGRSLLRRSRLALLNLRRLLADVAPATESTLRICVDRNRSGEHADQNKRDEPFHV